MLFLDPAMLIGNLFLAGGALRGAVLAGKAAAGNVVKETAGKQFLQGTAQARFELPGPVAP